MLKLQNEEVAEVQESLKDDVTEDKREEQNLDSQQTRPE